MTFQTREVVTVYDEHGNVKCRGKIMGIACSDPVLYDVQPDGEFSLSTRLYRIPAARIRRPEFPTVGEHDNQT